MDSMEKDFIETIQHSKERDSRERSSSGVSKKVLWHNNAKECMCCAPLLYAETLLDYGNYLFEYIVSLKQSNQKEFSWLKFYDMDLHFLGNDVVEKNTKTVEISKKKDLREKTKNMVANVVAVITAIYDDKKNKSLDKLMKMTNDGYPDLEVLKMSIVNQASQDLGNLSIDKLNNTFDKLLENNSSLTDEDENIKKEFLILINKKLKEYGSGNIETFDKWNSEIIKAKETETHADSSQLFRHLRNAFAHGNVEIDYSGFLKHGYCSNLMFIFSDPGDNSEEAFKLKISASNLIKLYNEMCELIVNQITQMKTDDYKETLKKDKMKLSTLKEKSEELDSELAKTENYLEEIRDFKKDKTNQNDRSKNERE